LELAAIAGHNINNIPFQQYTFPGSTRARCGTKDQVGRDGDDDDNDDTSPREEFSFFSENVMTTS